MQLTSRGRQTSCTAQRLACALSGIPESSHVLLRFLLSSRLSLQQFDQSAHSALSEKKPAMSLPDPCFQQYTGISTESGTTRPTETAQHNRAKACPCAAAPGVLRCTASASTAAVQQSCCWHTRQQPFMAPPQSPAPLQSTAAPVAPAACAPPPPAAAPWRASSSA